MIQTYEPYRGIIICRSGGSYVLTTDYLAEIDKKDKEIEKLKRENKRLRQVNTVSETRWAKEYYEE